MTDTAKTHDETPELTEEELAAQAGEPLPERAAMSILTPEPLPPEPIIDGGTELPDPVRGDMGAGDGVAENPSPGGGLTGETR